MTEHSLLLVASNPETPASYLQELSKHSSEIIRAAVAINPSANEKTLLSLVGDSSDYVIKNLMEAQSKFDGRSYEFTRTKTTKLSLANVDAAAFILSLRENPSLNRFLSQVDSDLMKQKKWLIDYKKREAKRSEFYFIIKDMNDNSIGTVRLYDFQKGSFCWGSWIVNPGSPRKTAIESALNVYEFAFGILGFAKSHFDVRNNNLKVIDFHKRMGAKFTRSDDLDTFFKFTKEKYEKTRDTYKQFFSEQFST